VKKSKYQKYELNASAVLLGESNALFVRSFVCSLAGQLKQLWVAADLSTVGSVSEA